MNDDVLLRYSRQILMPEVGAEGQERLEAAHAIVMGLGGLGSPIAAYLAAAGVGRLTLVDFDEVDLTNLQRQILHGQADIGRPKVDSAEESLRRLNPGCRIDKIPRGLEQPELETLCAGADLILDGTDNFASRALINRAAVASRTPLISGAVIRFEGQLATFDFRDPDAPCYHCLYGDGGELGETCSESGVFASLPGVIGSLQATEALKLLIGLPTLAGRLLLVDGLTMSFRSLALARDPQCPVCGPTARPH
ncbi:Sulfur carrier protein adenylyltransferase ThiF [Thioalkalivibrio nitratireducens DSM 14787]|uniref:Molybdopterin-synthase adenylyltransferase n=1 Tax=Thioalkalivibrio nitratireducens (strain DSM 14787 / UNIQEM 213 / ALEN2) TaxID=1255043 RepID=L0DZ91_THIND|nr:molybdopterin-synthase adenylyltransferase MoeB [Thioalkalivibrio nitratireducens]AGA34322.1 Sulfur carrier protein adenylyltransferase ThiF [Thioalkalivibrio nitratireducens DSM 14787]